MLDDYLSRQTVTLKTESEALGELLNEIYDNVFSPDNRLPIPTMPIQLLMIDIPVFSPYLIHKELDTSKIPCPNQLRPKLLKWLATFLAEPLAILFNNSLATAVVPGHWGAAMDCPIFTN